MHHTKRKKLQKMILEWYTLHGRKGLPWRETTDLYKITVSEIMLQQTNVPKVIQKYHAFLEKFPSWSSLAQARQSEVLTMWQGLGYNRRALYLHKMAQVVMEEFGGQLPEDPEVLAKLPGMGPYTRNAVLVFGRNQDLSACDVNLDRVVRRWHGRKEWDGPKGEREDVVASFVPKGHARDWHNAMMDFASTMCTKRTPSCMLCPLAKVCPSYPDPQDFRIVKKKEPGREEHGKHIPRRIFRGRIVEHLRSVPSTAASIGPVIKKDWNASSDTEWLEDLLARIAKDGMIEKVGKKWQLKD